MVVPGCGSDLVVWWLCDCVVVVPECGSDGGADGGTWCGGAGSGVVVLAVVWWC